METFDQLRNSLTLTDDHCLKLHTVPMVLMPRWFFVAIQKQVARLCGDETSRQVYYHAGYEGATLWAQTQIREAGLSGQAVMAQYLGSAGMRGWGRFTILSFETDQGRGRFRLDNSAVAIEIGPVGKTVCDHLPGSLAGAFQAILDHDGKSLKVIGREIKCKSQGNPWCEFVVEPSA